jgi:hypothetical protein
MEQPGKLTFRLYKEADKTALEEFCHECALLGYENNASLKAMKLDQAYFFIALDGNKIISVAGVHKLPEVNEHAWRCLFRGAQLHGYTPQWSLDIFKSGIHFSQFLYRQIKLVQDIDPQAEFYVSTNVKSNTGAKSSRLNDVMMPRIAKRGIWKLHLENFELYHVPQNLWKVNVAVYMGLRERWLSGESYTD